jgi:hypothetical protein
MICNMTDHAGLARPGLDRLLAAACFSTIMGLSPIPVGNKKIFSTKNRHFQKPALITYNVACFYFLLTLANKMLTGIKSPAL